jgi:hypothetical protein
MGRRGFSSLCRFSARAFLVVGGALVLGRWAVSASPPDGEHKKALCAYHLMLLGRAIQMYANDNDGYICELRGRVDWQAREGKDNADPYAKTHTRSQAPDLKPPADQPDIAYDHYYTSYRHYASVRGETTPVRLDSVLVEKDEMTANLLGGQWVATPDMLMLMMDDGVFHGTALSGQYGAVYARNVLFRDGHVKFETEETMRRPKP